MTNTTRKLRSDLTPEQIERALKIGSVEFKSIRNASRKQHDPKVFIPSKEQH